MVRSGENNDFLLELYHDSMSCEPDALRLRTLKNLQQILPFDFAVWGGGRADDRMVTDLAVLDQSDAVLGDWEAVAHDDAFCDLTLTRLGQTARFDDVANYRRSFAYNDHWRRFDASHMMATITAEKSDGYVSFVGLCADGQRHAFSDTERAFKQALMPHLSQALRINRDLWTGRAAINSEAVAMIDRQGWILSRQGRFDEIATEEWGARLCAIPPDVMRTLTGHGVWHGRAGSARLSTFGNACFIHLASQPGLSLLTPREREVAKLYAADLTHRQVAAALGTSPSTVRNQLARVYDKLEISSKTALSALFRHP
ncbi:MAG: helix-turn-helix transcriptional regulator [Euryhalocaulis sp.]|uniref:helix-turn-helix transcriptional regulator n=1 Tax=Euryhalocaulis sp. TaxID=2744307 RepID=UPI0017CAE387|nr:helix-turn-helix transcriptional regulator [Euryhalocaulis sp.]MBA4800816.1 helix-turn-helix transcriptional regulator [Euryhalocaulis sp.]